MLAGSSTEYSDLCLKLLVHEGAEKGAARGTVSVANQGNVSLVVESVTARPFQLGISLRRESRRIGDLNAEGGLASIMEALGCGV